MLSEMWVSLPFYGAGIHLPTRAVRGESFLSCPLCGYTFTYPCRAGVIEGWVLCVGIFPLSMVRVYIYLPVPWGGSDRGRGGCCVRVASLPFLRCGYLFTYPCREGEESFLSCPRCRYTFTYPCRGGGGEGEGREGEGERARARGRGREGEERKRECGEWLCLMAGRCFGYIL